MAIGSSKPRMTIPRIGISCGDLHGVGLEVVLKTFEDNRIPQDVTPILYQVPKPFRSTANNSGWRRPCPTIVSPMPARLWHASSTW